MGIDLGGLLGMGIGAVSQYQMAKLSEVPVSDSPYIPNVIENIFSETQMVDATGRVVSSCGHKRKTRRRRKRLATMSDISDLAALKAVLGGGKAFETWIATH